MVSFTENVTNRTLHTSNKAGVGYTVFIKIKEEMLRYGKPR